MGQFSFGNIDEGNTDGFDLADMLESFEEAINSMHAGNTEPTYKITGMQWRDTSGTPHLIKMWTGGVWIIIGSLNTATGIFTPYFQGAVQTIISTLAIGQGLESNAGALRIKLRDSSLLRDNNGVGLSETGAVAGSYTNASLSVDAHGRITTVTNGADPIQPVTPGGNYVLAPGIIPSQAASGTSWTLAGRVFVKRSGVIRVGFTLTTYSNDDNATNYASIYLNDASIYTVSRGTRTSGSITTAYYNDTVVNMGDTIAWYTRTNESGRPGTIHSMYIGVAETDVPMWPYAP